ncbi:MAG: tetratricopeptide repeat protein [Candidatus Obscuribacterales bacterium]|nr:tetratricopeptide repeat protein [Candidatus Obscuribacterales bacterium]
MEISRASFRINRLAMVVVFSVLISATGMSYPVAAESKHSWSSAYEAGEQALLSASPGSAVVHFRKAVELARKQSRNSFDLDKCQLKLASTLALLDKTAEARAISTNVLGRLEKKYGGKSPKTAPVLMTLGAIEESAGDHSAAMSYYNQALSIAERNYGPYSPVAASALHGLGRLHGKTGNREEAVSSYKRAISILSKEPNLEAAKQLESVTHDYADLLKGNDDSNRDLIKDFNKDILQEKNDPQASLEQSYQPPRLRPALT